MKFWNQHYYVSNPILRIIHRIIFVNIWRICFLFSVLVVSSIIPFDWTFYPMIGSAILLGLHIPIALIIGAINGRRNQKLKNGKTDLHM